MRWRLDLAIAISLGCATAPGGPDGGHGRDQGAAAQDLGAGEATVPSPADALPPPDSAEPEDAAPSPSDAETPSDGRPSEQPPDVGPAPDAGARCAVDPRAASQGGRIAAAGAQRAGAPLLIDAFADTGLTDVALSGVGPQGALRLDYQFVDGGEGAPFRWRFQSLEPAARGRYCLIFEAGRPAVFVAAAAIDVGPAGGEADTVFKVVRNHQWTCEENRFDIQLQVRVRDEGGAPLVGEAVRITHSGNNRYEDGRFERYPVPARIVTDGEGIARLPMGNRWPVGERADGSIDFFVLALEIEGALSDRAVELTTGFWQTNENVVGVDQACTYCPGGENVWGHWSYTVEFQRRPGQTELCDVPTDHAGMAACAVAEHVGHDPARPICQPL